MVLAREGQVPTKLPKFESIIIKDKKGERILIRAYDHKKDREKLITMYQTFDPDQRCLGLPPLSRKAIENWIDYLADSGFAIVAEKNDRLVGHLVIVPSEDGRVDLTIFVHQDYQNRGIGQEMMKLMIEFCRKAKFKGIILVTERTNARAIHVYKKLGFRVVAPYYEYDMYLPLEN